MERTSIDRNSSQRLLRGAQPSAATGLQTAAEGPDENVPPVRVLFEFILLVRGTYRVSYLSRDSKAAYTSWRITAGGRAIAAIPHWQGAPELGTDDAWFNQGVSLRREVPTTMHISHDCTIYRTLNSLVAEKAQGRVLDSSPSL